MGRKYQPLSKTVKEAVDLVFELTTSNPDGYEMKAKDLGRTGGSVVKILHQRGILERIRMKNRVHAFLYKWVAASAPTKVLYGSITQELSDKVRKMNEKYNAKKKSAEKASVDVIAEETVPAPAVETFHDGPVQVAPSLDPFSAQELWDELKRRGYSADENGLFIVKKTYLD